MKNNWIVTIILVLIVAAGAFFAGIQFQRMQRSSRNGGNFPNRFGVNGMRPMVGEIVTSDDKSVTIKMLDGSSKIVILSGSTSINKAALGIKTDLKTGERVAVFGTQNSDGTITAQNIQLNPQFRGFGKTPSPSQ